MKRILKMTFTGLLGFAAVSCGKEMAGGEVNGTVYFSIVPTVTEAGAAEIEQVSRAKVTGSAFPAGTTIGLRISAPSASPAISPFYDNFFATYNGETWLYYLDNVNAGDRLSGFSNWGRISVDGYYPYNNAVTDLAEIPFRIASMNGAIAEATDAMVATDFMAAETQTKDMLIPDPAGALPLRFGHVMTAIEFEVNRSISSVPLLKLDNVTYEISGGSPARKFTVSGTYNAISPDLDNMTNNIAAGDTANTMVISYPSSFDITSLQVKSILLVMMPELRWTSPADDATITMTFRFRDQDGEPFLFQEVGGGNPSITFNLYDITNGNNDRGLLAGWSYTVKATLGHYTRFVAPTEGTPMPPHVNYTELVDDPNNEFVDI